MNDELRQDLRSRRRLDTRQEIHRAALELFEEQGVRETTVQQIAERSGVSPRTFFRHFTTKEQAGLPGQLRLLRSIEELEVTGTDPDTVLRDVETALEGVMGREHDPEREEHRRVARLLAGDSELRALAAAQERGLASCLRERLTRQLEGQDPTTVLLVVEVAVAVWSTCWERWGELAAQGREEDPVELYRRCRSELRRIVG